MLVWQDLQARGLIQCLPIKFLKYGDFFSTTNQRNCAGQCLRDGRGRIYHGLWDTPVDKFCAW